MEFLPCSRSWNGHLGVSNKEDSHGLCPGESSFAAKEIGVLKEQEKARVAKGGTQMEQAQGCGQGQPRRGLLGHDKEWSNLLNVKKPLVGFIQRKEILDLDLSEVSLAAENGL